MHNNKKNSSLNPKSDLRKEMSFQESKENEVHHHSQMGFSTPTNNKKILGERNIINAPSSCAKNMPKPPATYDPLINFTSPRPTFLRYNPNRRKEILERMEVEEEDSQSSSSSTSTQEEVTEEDEIEESDAEEEGVLVERKSTMVWKLIFLIGIFMCFYHFLFPMSSSVNETQMEKNLLVRNLASHLGLSDVCLSGVGEHMCPIDDKEGINVDLVPMSDAVEDTVELVGDAEEGRVMVYVSHDQFLEQVLYGHKKSEADVMLRRILSSPEKKMLMLYGHEPEQDIESRIEDVEEVFNESLRIPNSVPAPIVLISMLAVALVAFLSVILKYFSERIPVAENNTDTGVAEEKLIEPTAAKEDMPSTLDRLRETYDNSSYATRQPALRLLGEFSIADLNVSGDGQSFKRVESEVSQISLPGRMKAVEESSYVSQSSQRRSTRKNISTSAELTSDASHRAQQKKLPRIQDSSSKGEEEMTAPTPVRRSSRLRNRTTTPSA